MAKRKVAIIGAGNVGITIAYTLMLDGSADDIAIISKNKEKALGQALDLSHGIPLVNNVKIAIADYDDCRAADIIVIAAGAKTAPGETRLDLAKRNIGIFSEVMTEILKHNSAPMIIIVSNPVDVLTYMAITTFGLPATNVIGSGTVLDSSRFRYFLGKNCNVNPSDVHAYIVGEHGDSQLPLWSLVTIGGVPFDIFCEADPHSTMGAPDRKEVIADLVKDAAYFVRDFKGATYYAISVATLAMVKAILRDENGVMSVSGWMNGQYGLKDVCLSLPSIVNAKGRAAVLAPRIPDDEIEGLVKSANSLHHILDSYLR